MKVKDLMSRPAVEVAGSATCQEAAQLMQDRQTGALVVLNDQRRIDGIVTDRDLVMKCIAAGRDPTGTPVSDCCHFHPVTIDPEEDVASAVERMRDAGVRRLPVVSGDGEIVGMLALDDIARDVREYVDAFASAVGQYSKSI
jgi:signal-transduction protein with cAMP-binding, CBS, and nucleotidyltransferase domain